ncbi:MAG: Maf family protein [Clostridiales bacterium]|nr:Maf family protein [Clostridiales bacterium]
MKIILASASPRRKELIEKLGMDFEVIPSHWEEVTTEEEPDRIVVELACGKAKDVAQSLDYPGDTFIIGADTIVVRGSEILGKPGSEEEAYEMLKSLSGRPHRVFTGVSILKIHDAYVEERSFEEHTIVEFYPMSDEEIWDYIHTGEPMDKAGAYGIQGIGGKFIRQIMGDYNTVVGLPLARIYQELSHWEDAP